MPGTWIKWTKGLPNKPEVIRLAGILRVTRGEVVCRLMAFWEWCDDTIPAESVLADGTGVIEMSPLAGDNAVTVDAIAGAQGFAAALVKVGWARFTDGLLEVPNFGRHNGETAKTRARNSLNQKKKRSVSGPPETPNGPPRVTKMSPAGGDITGDKTVTRGEEIREEKKNTEEEDSPEPAEPASGPAADPVVMTFPVVGKGPKEWPLAGLKLAEWQEAFPGLDTAAEARKARQWLLDNPTRRKTAGGMMKFLGGWFGRAQDNGPRNTGPPKPFLDKTTQYAMDTLANLFGDQPNGPPAVDPGPRLVITTGPDAG